MFSDWYYDFSTKDASQSVPIVLLHILYFEIMKSHALESFASWGGSYSSNIHGRRKYSHPGICGTQLVYISLMEIATFSCNDPLFIRIRRIQKELDWGDLGFISTVNVMFKLSLTNKVKSHHTSIPQLDHHEYYFICQSDRLTVPSRDPMSLNHLPDD